MQPSISGFSKTTRQMQWCTLACMALWNGCLERPLVPCSSHHASMLFLLFLCMDSARLQGRCSCAVWNAWHCEMAAWSAPRHAFKSMHILYCFALLVRTAVTLYGRRSSGFWHAWHWLTECPLARRSSYHKSTIVLLSVALASAGVLMNLPQIHHVSAVLSSNCCSRERFTGCPVVHQGS